jgi:hypothetical protein
MTGPARHGVPAGARRAWGRALGAGTLVAVIALGAYLVLSEYLAVGHGAAGHGSAAPRPGGAGTQGSAGSAPLAPDGTFTTVGGKHVTIASLRGRPAMVWFVAGGCASCAASIPAVAAHLRQLTADGLRVVTLGLAGDFPAGEQGLSLLADFGRAAAGGPITRPGWIWGVASASLSRAYDPGGTPDMYALISPSGRITYRGSVPVSTMPQLLAAAAHLAGHPAAGQAAGQQAAATAVLP